MNVNPKRACGLVRVSTDEQARGGFGLKFQEEDIRHFCERNGFDLLEIFRDEGYSGSTADRPGFRAMMEWAREKRFDVLLVWKLDRLFRDTKLTLQTVDELAALGIEFRSVQEAFTHDSNGRFLLTIFAAGAEKERKDITLRMLSGRLAAARRGAPISGISNPAYGYKYDKTSRQLIVDEEEAEVVRQIFRWYVNDKVSLYKIQSRLNDRRIPTKYDRLGRPKRSGTKGWWASRVVGRILSNEIYVGRLVLRKYKERGQSRKEGNQRPREDWITIPTPPIVSEELFDLAQKQLAANFANSSRNTKRRYLLGKLLVCGNDGRRMQAHAMPGAAHDVKYYYCSATDKAHAATPCRSQRIREDRVAPAVWQALKELLRNPGFVLGQLTDYKKEVTKAMDAGARKQSLENNRKNVQERLRRLAEVYIAGAVDKQFYDSESRTLRAQAEVVARELKRVNSLLMSTEQMAANERTLQELYAQHKEKLDGAADEVKREIFREFIRSIVVRGEDLEIEVTLPSHNAVMEQQFYPQSRDSTPSLGTTAGPQSSSLSHNGGPSLFLKAHLLPRIRHRRTESVA